MTTHARISAIAAAAAASLLAGALATACSTYKEAKGGAPSGQTTLEDDARAAMRRFEERDPTLRRFFDHAYAMAVFPVVAKGAAGIGAAHGHGVVFKDGRAIATTELTQGTIGVQLGGQTYSQIVFFENEASFGVFKAGRLKFQAQASAVATESGAAASSDFAEGVAVFVMPRAGLMFEAAIGGQQFTYVPLTETADAGPPPTHDRSAAPATASTDPAK
jgi:hypothetical protein